MDSKLSVNSHAETRNTRDLNEPLPQSFAALRPSSLPAPSHIRPPIRSRDGRSNHGKSPSEHSLRGREASSRTSNASAEIALSPQQQDIRKLVGADLPAHRGFWRANSDSWKIFEGNNSDQTEEEDSDGDTVSNGAQSRSKLSDLYLHFSCLRRVSTGERELSINGIAGSLPIPMHTLTPQKLSGTASLRPQTSPTDRPGPPLTTIEEEYDNKTSAAARRSEVYAERNRLREMDPGMLDFTGDVATDETSPEGGDDLDQVSTSRSRQHALNIIKARNSVPAEGLWRSLA